MTEIYEVSGLEKSVRKSAPQSSSEQGIIAEMRQRAQLVKKRPPIDTAILSEGELSVELMRQRYQMLADYYPDFPGYQKAADMADNALHNGLHTGAGVGAWTRILDPEQQEVAWAIINGRGQTNPASGWVPNWDDKARTPAMGGISIGAIPLLNCEQLYPIMPQSSWNAATNNPSGYPSYFNAQMQKREACIAENKWRSALNSYWEKGSQTLLYNFLPPSGSGYFAGIDEDVVFNTGIKAGNHRYAFEKIRDASKISNQNLKAWLENGNIANSIAFGLGAQSGLEFIDGLKANANIDMAINGFIASLVSVAADCLKNTFTQFQLFIGVVKGDLSLKQALQIHVQNVTDFFQKHAGNIENLANTKDFRNPKLEDFELPPPPTKCPDDEHWDDDKGECVPDKKGGFDLGSNGLLIGAALVGGALLLGGDKK